MPRSRPLRSAPRRTSLVSMLALCLLLPAMLGGCPEFQDASADAFETAARTLLDAALDLFFDQYRTDASK